MIKKIFLLIVTSIALSPTLLAGGAGILPMAIDSHGNAVFLLGKERRWLKRQNTHYECWSDFGGRQDPGKKPFSNSLS